MGNLSVTFGHGSTPGLVVTNGSLASLDMTVNSSFTIGSVVIAAQDLEFTYTAATNTFTLGGTASVIVGSMGQLSVTFGHDSTPGLVVSNGSLVSLDMTVNGSFTVSSVTIAAQDLEFTYSAATSTFTLGGTASVTIGDMSNLSVTFGHDSTPGLVISHGALVSLDMTVNSQFHGFPRYLLYPNLEFSYTASPSTFTMSGTAGVDIKADDFLSVTFGHGSSHPGLVIATRPHW